MIVKSSSRFRKLAKKNKVSKIESITDLHIDDLMDTLSTIDRNEEIVCLQTAVSGL